MKYTPVFLTTALLSATMLVGCSDISTSSATSAVTTTQATSGVASSDLAPDAVLAANADYTTVNDDEWDASTAKDIDLNDANGTITISEAGVYRLSGSLDGQVSVQAPDDALVVLILDGATITNTAGPAINVVSADDVAISLAAGSTNVITDAESYADDDTANAAINADTDLTISGTGSLTVNGRGNDGISSTDDLVILSSNITVTAADDALRGKDSLVVEGGTLTLSATHGDGLKSDQEDDQTQGYILITGGTIDITAGDDGIQAQTDTIITGGTIQASVTDDGVKAEQILTLSDGTVTVVQSTEAMEAADISISGGSVDLTASDDGINASGNNDTAETTSSEIPQGGGFGGDVGGGSMQDTGERLEISGGTTIVDAEGDGLDSNGSLTMSGGDVTIYGSVQGGNGALDANGEMTISGGTLAAFGAGHMEQTPSGDASQGWVVITGQFTAGQEVDILDDSGATVATVTARKSAGALTFSSATIQSGSTYTASAAGTQLGTGTAGAATSMGGAGGMGAPGGPGDMGTPRFRE